MDDAVENLQILMSALQDRYAVVTARNGYEALERVDKAPPDIVLLDIIMPDMDGYETCRRLKAREDTREIPVIFLTGLIEEKNEIMGLALGAVDYVHKPFSVPVIQARVATHLELFRARRAVEERNQALLEAHRLREEVERITQHDLKSPLNAIIGLPEALMCDANLTGEQRTLLETIQLSGYRLLDMINRSLDMYKMETGTYAYQPYPVNLIKVVHKIAQENQKLIAYQHLNLQMLVDGVCTQPEVFEVPGEELLCYSMLANLLKNAIEASPEQGCITVRLGKTAGMASIAIHNQGAVPESIRERFFDKYVTCGKESGTGLGTYSALRIAETMGGNIMLDSNDPAATTIIIRLPL